MADTAHSDCVTRRTMALAAGTGDNLLLHVPLSRGFTMRQRGGAETHGFYHSIPRSLLGKAAALPLRDQIALTPPWRLLLAYPRGIHAEAAQLSTEVLEICAGHVLDLVLLALGADRDTEQIAKGRAARVARLRAITDAGRQGAGAEPAEMAREQRHLQGKPAWPALPDRCSEADRKQGCA